MQYRIVPVTLFQQNCTILWDEHTLRGAVIDPGGEIEEILALVHAEGITLEKILVTHAHVDHAGQVWKLAKEQQLPIEGPHRDEQFWIDRLAKDAAKYAMPDVASFEPDRWLNDGDTVDVAGHTLQVFHCPGHTPGHVVFYVPEDKVAIVGDVIFQGSIGRTDFPRGNHADLIHSIREKLWPLGNDVQFISGHGPISTFGFERQHNPYVADSVLQNA
ncbi:MAG: MBL fold metallo-hydrolase [Gammaproteobacteria bacterium]|nr:MBL fold metallo-hydrolase [Gammaproteobacteria bacterium]